jgi:DNA-binding Lrp family transcriptional regulator
VENERVYENRLPHLDSADRALLDLIQTDIPLVERPFTALGSRCGLPEEEVMERIRGFLEQRVVRNYGALLDSSKIGYKSTLVAVTVPEVEIDTVAERINSHPGVSHNYLRNHHYNIWFTLALPREQEFRREIEAMMSSNEYPRPVYPYLVLPSIETFKLRVKFDFGTVPKSIEESGEERSGNSPDEFPVESSADSSTGPPVDSQYDSPGQKDAVPDPDRALSRVEKKLLKAVQHTIPISPRPWQHIGAEIGVDEAEVVEMLASLKHRGVIRRIAAILRHRALGYTANGMTCFNVADDSIHGAGRIAASFQEVSHCYHRPRQNGWDYPLFAMIHSHSRAACEERAVAVAEAIGCGDYLVLFSERELKKERVDYVSYRRDEYPRTYTKPRGRRNV